MSAAEEARRDSGRAGSQGRGTTLRTLPGRVKQSSTGSSSHTTCLAFLNSEMCVRHLHRHPRRYGAHSIGSGRNRNVTDHALRNIPDTSYVRVRGICPTEQEPPPEPKAEDPLV